MRRPPAERTTLRELDELLRRVMDIQYTLYHATHISHYRAVSRARGKRRVRSAKMHP